MHPSLRSFCVIAHAQRNSGLPVHFFRQDGIDSGSVWAELLEQESESGATWDDAVRFIREAIGKSVEPKDESSVSPFI